MSTNDFNRYMTELEFASILGTPYMGTGNDPTNANTRNIGRGTLAGEKWEALNAVEHQLVRDPALPPQPRRHTTSSRTARMST